MLVEGFFPDSPPDAEPLRQRTVGLQELGLPYASDPAMTKHLAHFIHRQHRICDLIRGDHVHARLRQ